MLTNRSPKLLLKALPIATLLLPLFDLFSAVAIAQTTFGEIGQDGDRGRDGRDGRDGQNIRIVSDGKPAAYNLMGTSAEDGEDGTAGRSASSCQPPYRPEYSLIGASGGRGGNAGNGGRGGNGGNVTIFYNDIATLQQLEIRNGGGRGGRNGRGAIGGKGCECREAEWRVRYCNWEIERRPFHDAKASWEHHSRETRICGRSGDSFDHPSSRVSEYRRDDWLYRRTYKSISRSQSYTCQQGRDGEASRNGRNGATGNYGQITLVPRLDIPSEITSDRVPLATALGKKVSLIKNIWVDRTGLSRLLRPSSDVSDGYTYLKDTAKLFYRFEWGSQSTPTALGIDRVEMGTRATVRNESAEITYQIPATLEYEVIPATPPENTQVVKITGGFNPDRVSSFELQSISGIGTENQLVLSDRGNVRELLKDTQIEVQCLSKQSATGIVTNDYVTRRSINFKISPKSLPSDGAIVTGNTYALPVGRYCSPWLKANNDVSYQIAIAQITKSGARYDQSLESTFVVGKN